MNLSNINFPYPVLGSYDDILPAPSDPEVEITKDSKEYHFDIKLDYDNNDIKRLVDQDYADYVCEVSCDATRFRNCYFGKSLNIKIDLPRKSVARNIVFTCTITVKKTIKDYVNKGFHPDYYGHVFTMEPGDILGILGFFSYNADIKYDKLKAYGTFMEIVETDDELPSTILDKDKIEVRLPTKLFKQYKDEPSINSKADVLHSSIVLNSLIYALCRIEKYEGKRWADTIMYRISTEKELEEFRDQDPEDWRVDKLTQILLGKPYERMFTYLVNNKDNT